MRYLVFALSVFISIFAQAAQPAAEDLRGLLFELEGSETFQAWHEARANLDTRGYEIWLTHRFNDDFCKEVLEFPDELLTEVRAWRQKDDKGCELKISSRLQNLPVFHSTKGFEKCRDIPSAPTKHLGPSREVILDTLGGPRLVTGDLQRCEVALTFDDGPHPALTEQLLMILARERVQANFFMVGRNVRRHPRVADRVAGAGHVVGNHSYSHRNFPKISYREAKQEILGGFEALLSIWDYTTPFFRFPYGAFTKKTRAFLQNNDVAEFFWNMDTLDWKYKSVVRLFSNIAREIDREKRGILLFHDVQPQTIEVMPQVLLALKEAGYTTAVFLPEDLIEDEF